MGLVAIHKAWDDERRGVADITTGVRSPSLVVGIGPPGRPIEGASGEERHLRPELPMQIPKMLYIPV